MGVGGISGCGHLGSRSSGLNFGVVRLEEFQLGCGCALEIYIYISPNPESQTLMNPKS